MGAEPAHFSALLRGGVTKGFADCRAFTANFSARRAVRVRSRPHRVDRLVTLEGANLALSDHVVDPGLIVNPSAHRHTRAALCRTLNTRFYTVFKLNFNCHFLLQCESREGRCSPLA